MDFDYKIKISITSPQKIPIWSFGERIPVRTQNNIPNYKRLYYGNHVSKETDNGKVKKLVLAPHNDMKKM